MIFGILNQIGGVGKTTLAVHPSAALTMMGNLVPLVDAGSKAALSTGRKAGKPSRYSA